MPPGSAGLRGHIVRGFNSDLLHSLLRHFSQKVISWSADLIGKERMKVLSIAYMIRYD
jgi:hypothetical protein